MLQDLFHINSAPPAPPPRSPEEKTTPSARGFNAHDRTAGKEEWFTPKYITDALGPFDLDPCAAIVRPHDIATRNLTIRDDGLKTNWGGNSGFAIRPMAASSKAGSQNAPPTHTASC